MIFSGCAAEPPIDTPVAATSPENERHDVPAPSATATTTVEDAAALAEQLFNGSDPRANPSMPDKIPQQVPLIQGNVVQSEFAGVAEEKLAYGTWEIYIVMGLGPDLAEPLRAQFAKTGFSEEHWAQAPDGTVDARYTGQEPQGIEVTIRIGPYSEIPDAVPAADLSIDPETWYVYYGITVPMPENY